MESEKEHLFVGSSASWQKHDKSFKICWNELLISHSAHSSSNNKSIKWDRSADARGHPQRQTPNYNLLVINNSVMTDFPLERNWYRRISQRTKKNPNWTLQMFGICGDRAHYASHGSILHVQQSNALRGGWIRARATFQLPPRAPIRPTVIPMAHSRLALPHGRTATSVSFILKLFKLETQSNTYNFTIMAIVAVWLRSQLFVRPFGWWCGAGPHHSRRTLHTSQMLEM